MCSSACTAPPQRPALPSSHPSATSRAGSSQPQCNTHSPALPHRSSSRQSQRCCARPSPASVSAASMPPPPARPALAPSSLCWLSGRGGFKPDREFIRAKVSPGRLLPGREGRAPFSYSSAFLPWELSCLGRLRLPAPALFYTSPPLSDPTPRRVSHRSRRY